VNPGLLDPRWRGLTIGLVLNVTFVAFEALAVATIMPLVAQDLSGLTLYGWVFSAFLLADLAGIVVAGELADRHGPGVPFGIGLVLFVVGLLAGGLAPAMPVLVAARAIQGFGAGAIPAAAYVVIGRTFPEALRPRMFAILSTAWVVPGIAGPALAAFVGDHVGWRWVFLGLLPLVVTAGGLAYREVRKVPGHPGRVARRVEVLATEVERGRFGACARYSEHQEEKRGDGAHDDLDRLWRTQLGRRRPKNKMNGRTAYGVRPRKVYL